MEKKILKKKEYCFIIIPLLIISIGINLFLTYRNSMYGYRMDYDSYQSTVDIINKNNNNIEILDSAIKNSQIKVSDLYILYRNYTDISKNIANLWDDYQFYQESTFFRINKKTINTESTKLNDNNTKLQTYIKAIIDLQSNNKSDTCILTTNMKYSFTDMLNMANDIEDFYSEFSENELGDVTDEKKVKKFINNKYWIDILNGLYDVDQKYSDEQFTV